jgi:putative spermidine/putrescine transport system permease protein
MLPLILSALGALFLLAPILVVVPMSFSTAISFAFPPPGYWLGYYAKYFTSEEWLEPTLNSFVIAFGAMTLTMLLVVPAAFGYVRYRFRGKTLVNLLIMAPLIVPHVVSALAYYGFLGRAKLTGTLPGVMIAHGMLAVPVAFLVVSATLKGFDQNLERAAMSSGAGPLRTFVHVTLPILRPGMLVAALFAFLSSFNEAVVSLFIAGRGAVTLPKKMYESIRLESDPVIAVVSTLLVSSVALGVLVSLFLRRRSAHVA